MTIADQTDDLSPLRSYAVQLARYACGGFAGRTVSDPVYQSVTEGRHQQRKTWPYSSCGDLPGWMLRALGYTGELNRSDRPGGWRVGQNFTPLLELAERITHPASERWQPGDILFVDLSRKNAAGVYLSHVCVVVADDGRDVVTADYGQAPMAGKQSAPDMTACRLKWRKRTAAGLIDARLPERIIDLDRVPLAGLPDVELGGRVVAWEREHG